MQLSLRASLLPPRVDVRLNSEVVELQGERGRLRAVVVRDSSTGEQDRLPAHDVMVFIGGVLSTSWSTGNVTLDDGGYVVTGPDADAGRGGAGTPMLQRGSPWRPT